MRPLLVDLPASAAHHCQLALRLERLVMPGPDVWGRGARLGVSFRQLALAVPDAAERAVLAPEVVVLDTLRSTLREEAGRLR